MPKRKKEHEEHIETCAICLEDKKVKELTLLNHCCHKYCEECITKWSAKSNECPQCKATFTMLDIPGRKSRKRVKRRRPEREDGAFLLISAYLRSASFRQLFARSTLAMNDYDMEVFHFVRRSVLRLAQEVDINNMDELDHAIMRAHVDITELSIDLQQRMDIAEVFEVTAV